MKPQINWNWRGSYTGDDGTSVAREDEGLVAKKARMLGPYRQVAVLIILGSLLPSPVFSQVEPLSTAEIQAAREAMKLFRGARIQAAREAMKFFLENEPAPEELVRSAKSITSYEPRGFAEFAGPFTHGQKVRRSVICEFPPPEWRCRGSTNEAIGARDSLPTYLPPAEKDKAASAYDALARAMLFGFASVIIIPWVGLMIGWQLRAAAAGYLATGATIVFVVSQILGGDGNIRLDLLLFVPPAMLAWLNFFAISHQANNSRSGQAMGGSGKFLFSILAVANVFALALLLLFYFD